MEGIPCPPSGEKEKKKDSREKKDRQERRRKRAVERPFLFFLSVELYATIAIIYDQNARSGVDAPPYSSRKI